MAARRGAGTALQHELSAHELGVIFTRSAFGRDEAGIGQKRGTRPLPDIAEHLTQAAIRSRCARARSEERPVGKECVSTCSSRWSSDLHKKNTLLTDLYTSHSPIISPHSTHIC